MKRRWREERAGERVQEGIENRVPFNSYHFIPTIATVGNDKKKMDEDPLEPLLTLGRRVDVSVAECFLQGQVASLSPNLAAAVIEPGYLRITKESINSLCYNRLSYGLTSA